MEKGDKIIVPEGRGEWICELDRVFPEECTARTLEFRGCDAEPKKNITLYMAYTKSDKMEIVVQKAVNVASAGNTVEFTDGAARNAKKGRVLVICQHW